MNIDLKAVELAKALADASDAQNTPEYREFAQAAERKAEIDAVFEAAASALEEHYNPTKDAKYVNKLAESIQASSSDAHDIFEQPISEPERYELPEDETATARPSDGLNNYPPPQGENPWPK
jgi:hypothetical protein